jgi:uncharacterized protein (DUF1697 family)
MDQAASLAAGCPDVKIYIQSGNVLFATGDEPFADLCGRSRRLSR